MKGGLLLSWRIAVLDESLVRPFTVFVFFLVLFQYSNSSVFRYFSRTLKSFWGKPRWISSPTMGTRNICALQPLLRMKMLNCKSSFKAPVHLCQWERVGQKKKRKEESDSETEREEKSENSWQGLRCDTLAQECGGNEHVQNPECLGIRSSGSLTTWFCRGWG